MELTNFHFYDLAAGKSVVAAPCHLVEIDGNYAGGGGEYFQIFDKASAPVANDVPIKSFLLSAAGPLPSIFQVIGTLTFSLGFAVGISTVNEKYTASGSAYDVFGETEDIPNVNSYPPLNYSTAGDLTTPTSAVGFWTNANGPHNLLQVDWINNDGVAQYLLLFGIETPVDGDPALETWVMPNTTTQQTKFLGRGGLWIRQFETNPALKGTLRQACTVVVSSTPGVLTLNFLSASCMRGYYI